MGVESSGIKKAVMRVWTVRFPRRESGIDGLNLRVRG